MVGELWVVPVPPLDPHAVTPSPMMARHASAATCDRTTLPNLVYPVKFLILLIDGLGPLPPPADLSVRTRWSAVWWSP